MTPNRKFDIIITGGGVAGFIAATVLQKYFKKKTALVTGIRAHPGEVPVELFLPALYTGQMEIESTARKVIDWVTGGKLMWERLPSIYERHFYPGKKLNLSDNLANYMDSLKELFPKEKGNIDLIFRDIQHAANYTSYFLMKHVLPKPLHGVSERFFASGRKHSSSSLEGYLTSLTGDKKFKTFISGQLQNLASCREATAFIFHSMNMMEFLNGAFAPAGGVEAMYRSLADGYTSSGGSLFEGSIAGITLSGKTVKSLDFKGNDGNGLQLRGRKILWGLGTRTLQHLVTKDEGTIQPVGKSVGNGHLPYPVIFEIQFDAKIQETNIRGEVFRLFPENGVEADDIPQAVSLYPVFERNTGVQSPEKYMAVVFINGEDTSRFLSSLEEIESLKEYVRQLIRRDIPHISGAISSIRHIMPATSGEDWHFNPYGTIMPDTMKASGTVKKNRWNLRNVYETDADLFMPGVVGSVMSGLASVGMMMGAFSFFKFFRFLKRESRKNVKIKVKPLKYKK